MKYRKIGRTNFPIEYPLLDLNYHCIYSQTYNKIYYGCPKNCKICKQWKKKGDIWKGFHFFPIHCHFCCYAGMKDDFYLENIFILCKNCHTKLNKRRKELNNFINKTI
jgi:hypothetical protein